MFYLWFYSRRTYNNKDTIKYKLIDIEANSNIWEGQFIEIEQEEMLVTKKLY